MVDSMHSILLTLVTLKKSKGVQLNRLRIETKKTKQKNNTQVGSKRSVSFHAP